MNTLSPSQPRPALIDRYGRRIDYLRVSVTDRCDLRCHYCLPKDFKEFETPGSWLSHEEMARLIGLFAGLGVSKVRLTGGEPLTRRGLAELAGRITSMPGIRDLSVSTNGTMLVRHAASLKAAGVLRLNVSLDTLDAARFKEITGRDCLGDVLDGLEEARRVGFSPIKLNCVTHADTPEAELIRLLGYTLASGFILRLIETMPVGEAGQRFQPANLTRLGEKIARRFDLVPALSAGDAGPARYWSAGGVPALGVITPMSRHFCASCNRVRITADGTLYLCLGHENQVPLGVLMRHGADDDALVGHILASIATKPERHEFDSAPRRIIRSMARTGG